MKYFKILMLFVVWPLIIFILIVGSWAIISIFQEKNKIEKEGLESTALIIKKWRGRCGSGYGNSAVFETIINNKKIKLEALCYVPDDVQIGDKYRLKYLKDDFTKNRVLFDIKLP